MSSASSGKTPRVLACVLCQHRKIKCDRHTPCANCVKANVTCTPSTPAPARKRRRPNQDLQQRLSRCEELLQEYATTKPSPTSTETQGPDDPWKSAGKLIEDDGGVRFMDSYLWAEVHDELRAMREIVDNDDKDDDSYCTPSDAQTPDQNTALIFSDGGSGSGWGSSTEDLHPEPAHAFRLWQTFLDRVNPLTKVIHVPTIQPLIVEAATSRANIPKNVEALLFSIYSMSAIALSEQECLSMLGYTKDEAFKRFSTGVRITLMRIGILHKYNLVILQAMVLYLMSLSGRYDRHAAWILNGVIVRIAQKMGLHRDGDTLGLPAFESEMRRRVWWQIVLLDATYALMSGLGQSLLPRSWDTKEPRNINDADLFPTMNSVEARDGPTDMIFCLTNYEIAKLLLRYPGLESVILQNELGDPNSPPTAEVDAAREKLDELDEKLSEVIRKYGDLSMGPVHELAIKTRSTMMSKLRDLICPPREQPEWGTEILTPKDNLFKIAVSTGENSVILYTQAQKMGYFLWFEMAHFQIEVFLYMVGQLCTRPQGKLVERAWLVVEQFYQFHTELFDLANKPNGALAVFVLRAWKRRHEFLRATQGATVVQPYYISRLQKLVGSDELMKEEASSDKPPPSAIPADRAAPSSLDMPWEQMLGFADSTAIDWDMFGSSTQPVNYQGFANVGNPPTNGWMYP
ncbi:fungal-specific transcription factor domain-containing protein [Pseudomassariella vexata]|uniref:Fungal-specific transcription factor domain-domain-containing protein n=1 Tax=Pseudomassariella vexata TaxID=1141098 RepID=A0A1Y2EKC2_9PEZI|nr:fungal-specific transcription factor domain-containing protein [Pseudomassariella vexata]ORY71978.1 fungal-specific transcription factor domain-domain-containing protein [Pseudomassariella vexata]